MVSCLEAAAKLLSDLGHTVVPWRWPDNCDACDAAVVFWTNELTVLVEEYAQALGRAPRQQELGSVIHWAMEQAHNTSSVDVARAQAQLIRLQRSMAASIDGVDVILSPVVTGPPPVSGMLTEAANTDIATWMDLAWRFAPYTEIFNVTGQPAMSVPLFQSQAGLPIGIHFAGRVGHDLPLMQLARQLEAALPWHDRRPPEPVRQTKTDVTQPQS